jgi:hypothetical protein
MVNGFRRLAVSLASAVLAASAIVAVSGAAAHSVTSPGWRITAIYPEHSEAGDLVATGPSNAWLVEGCGTPCHTGLGVVSLRHWNGTAWQLVANPVGLRSAYPLLALPPGAKSTPWAVFPYDPTSKNRGTVAFRRTGASWSAPHWFTNAHISAVVAPAPSVAWVFGDSEATGALYAQRWNGRTWSAAPAPKIFVVDASARSATDIWVTGVRPSTGTPNEAMVVSHWNGARWTTPALPPIPVPAGDVVQPMSIAVSGARDAWALAFVSKPGQIEPNDGLAMFHWNGSAWSPAPLPYKETIADGVTGDLHGGVWFWAHLTPGQDHMIHVTPGGKWTEFTVPRPAGAFGVDAGSIAPIPGTSSVWAAGIAQYHIGTQAVILKYGP